MEFDAYTSENHDVDESFPCILFFFPFITAADLYSTPLQILSILFKLSTITNITSMG
jgi:hypothetical protein